VADVPKNKEALAMLGGAAGIPAAPKSPAKRDTAKRDTVKPEPATTEKPASKPAGYGGQRTGSPKRAEPHSESSSPIQRRF